jgi:hypothetical protein
VPVIKDRGDLRGGPAGQLQPQRGGLAEQLRVRADHPASISSAVENRTRSRRTGPFCGGQPAALLADAVTILFARAQWLADHGKREWEPPPAMPALVIIIDEYAELARVPSRPRTAPARPPVRLLEPVEQHRHVPRGRL